MKKAIFGLLAIFFISVGCEKEENSLENLENKKIPLNSFFEKVISENGTTKKPENAFYIDYFWNKEDKTIEITKIVEKELDFFPISDNSSLNNKLERKKYQVTCTKGRSDVWTRECDGKFSCGSLIYDCLESGGCGTICSQRMIYIPERSIFVLVEL
jgi:hypothetical protein